MKFTTLLVVAFVLFTGASGIDAGPAFNVTTEKSGTSSAAGTGIPAWPKGKRDATSTTYATRPLAETTSTAALRKRDIDDVLDVINLVAASTSTPEPSNDLVKREAGTTSAFSEYEPVPRRTGPLGTPTVPVAKRDADAVTVGTVATVPVPGLQKRDVALSTTQSSSPTP